ncbi:hypothetical protein [Specibacter sp. NPDC078692]|uniref:hypothetical protein n=1 Tax=Specibacter sp. NPDC078692 TaxID=3155818 RepID=UPI0034316B40
MNVPNSISFSNIRMAGGIRIDLDCVIISADGTTDSHALWFEFNKPVHLDDNMLAVALSTLCGQTYRNIYMDLSPAARTVKEIEVFTSASVTTNGSGYSVDVRREGHVLSFSGGFDSLAALSLMPDGTELVSMDFGGRFGRERTFFENFDTTIVSTNLLDTPLKKNSWSFMGAGAILASSHQRREFHTFGSILEAGADNLRSNPVAAAGGTFLPFKSAGFQNAPYVLGLTEIGTLLVLARYQREHIGNSLLSLASPGEEKLYRKQVLANIIEDRLGTDLHIPIVQKPARPHFAFGENFALDFLTIYVAKYAGHDIANDLVRDIPPEILNLGSQLDLTFYERANSTLYENFPAPLMGGLAGKLAGAKIPFYVERDWNDFSRVREALAKYYPVVAS